MTARIEQPCEGLPVNPPQETESGDNANSRDHKDQLARLEAPPADSLFEEFDTGNIDGGPPDPPDLHPEITPETMAVESPTASPVFVPESGDAGIAKKVETSEKPQVFEIIEVRQRWIERMAR